MTTSETELGALTSKYPSEKETIKRLRDFIVSQKSGGDSNLRVYSMDRLITLIQPQSSWNFAHIIAELANTGILEQFIRLKSASGVGLGDFESYDEIPDKMHDITIDQEIEVDQDDLEVLYKIGTHE